MADNVVPIVREEDALLTADEILSTNDIEYKVVDAWGRKLRIQSLTAGDIIDWAEAGEGEAKKTAGLRLILKSAVDKDGKLLFTERHLPLLRVKNHKETEKVVEEIIKLNNLQIRGADIKKG
jgi:hypothetical protein